MKSKKWSWLLVAAAAVIIAVCGSNVKAAETKTVYVSVEKFTIGQGYVVEPVVATFEEGETYGDVIERVLEDAGYDCKITYDWGTPYLETVYGADSGVYNLPECIKNIDASVTAIFGDLPTNDAENINSPDLGEFSYSSSSGWLYCINDDYTGETGLSDGAVLRYQFSVYGWGYDLGTGGEWYGIENQDIPDRSNVTKQLAILNEDLKSTTDAEASAVYADAIKVVSNLDSTAQEVAAAEKNVIQQIDYVENGRPAAKTSTKKVSVGKVKLKKVKKAGAKKAKLTWKKVSGANGYQISMSKKKKGGYKVVKTVKKGSKKTCKVAKLKKGKKYYFKVRAYKKVNGKTYYGKYSKKIKVKM